MKRFAIIIAAAGLAATPAFALDTAATSKSTPKSHHHAHVIAGASVNAREQRETRALNLLEVAGYNDFSDLRADGRDYRATATKDGESVAVRIDPDREQVTRER